MIGAANACSELLTCRRPAPAPMLATLVMEFCLDIIVSNVLSRVKGKRQKEKGMESMYFSHISTEKHFQSCLV